VIIILLSLFLFECFASVDTFSVFQSEFGSVIRFLKAPSKKDLNDLSGLKYKSIDQACFPSGTYDICSSDKKEVRGHDIESLVCSITLINGKDNGTIIAVQNKPDQMFKVLELIVNKKNFENNGVNSTVVFDTATINLVDGVENLLRLAFDKQSVSINLVNQQTIFQLPEVAQLFDPGIYKFCSDCKVLKPKYNLNDFIKEKQKNNYNLKWYEKILYCFDSRYLFTKAFLDERAPWITVRHSQSFRKNFLRFVIMPLVMIGLIGIALKATRFRVS
jgi:hypothetical protein